MPRTTPTPPPIDPDADLPQAPDPEDGIDSAPQDEQPVREQAPALQHRTGGRDDSESAAGMPESRFGTEIPMSEVSGPLGADLGPISKKLSALGTFIEFQVQRLSPDLPVGEMGWGPWIKVIQSTPSAEDIEELIRKRYGGGEFEVRVRNTDLNRPQKDQFRIQLQGIWIAQTYEGHLLWISRHGGMGSQTSSGAPAPQMPAAGGSPTDAFHFASQAMQMTRDQQVKLEEMKASSTASNNDLILKFLLAQTQAPKPPSLMEQLPALLTALGTLATAILVPMREAAAAKEAAQQARHDQLLALMREREQPKTPQEQMAATMAILDVFKQGTMNRMSIEASILKDSIGQIMKGSNLPEGSPIWSFVREAIGNSGPDIVRALAAWVTAKAQAAPQPLPQPQPQAPRQIPPPPAGPGPASAAPAQPVQPGKTIWDAPSPNGSAPNPAAEAAFPLEQQGRVVMERATEQVLTTIRAFLPHMLSEGGPDREGVWDFDQVTGAEGRSTIDAFLLAPESFRKRMQEQQEAKAPPSAVYWVEGIQNIPVQTLAKDIDTFVSQQVGAIGKLAELIDFAPWVVKAEPQG